MSRPTYVFGHRNPDADAICSAIAYADFKRKTDSGEFVAARCGNSNVRIDAILDRFDAPLPRFIADVTPRLRDQMSSDVVTCAPDTTCAAALELIDRHDIQSLPVVTDGNRLMGVVTIFQLGQYFLPRTGSPREMRRVRTSVRSIVDALKGRVVQGGDDDEVAELFVRVGAMDIRSFNRFLKGDDIPARQTVVVVGDRRDIQERALELGVRLLVVTGGLQVPAEISAGAREAGVNLVVSPYDSATTAWVIRSAATVEGVLSREFVEFRPEATVQEVRRRTADLNPAVFMVTNDDNRLVGVFSRRDILRPSDTRIILVDHNELSQAVSGAGEVEIVEVVDHHRLGDLRTQNPIFFINRPVGSTCTIVADLYRREAVELPDGLAGVLMGGLVSDTLNLQSPTSTGVDHQILAWLEERAGVTGSELAELIFSSGSVVLRNTPEEAIRQDRKVYDEGGRRFSISQVEEVGMDEFWQKKEGLMTALHDLLEEESLDFVALMVTDVKSQNSLLVYTGDEELGGRINYPSVEAGRIFELHGVVSRKKQLLPFLTALLSGEAAPEMPGGGSETKVASSPRNLPPE